MKKDTRKYEKLVLEVRDLLAKAHSAWVDVFLRLRDVERGQVWKLGPHSASFSDFLRAEFPGALGYERYSNAIQAIELYGEKLVRQLGVDAARAMCVRAIVDHDERRRQLVRSIEQHILERGCAPRVDIVRRIARGIAPELNRPARVTLRAEGLDAATQARMELVQENGALRAENAALRTQLRVAKARIAELEKTVRKRGAPMPRSRSGMEARPSA